MRRLLLALALPALTFVVVDGRAAADCIGPTIEFPAGTDVTRGDIVHIEGTGWGDNCYDTGPPPPGEGTLGTPRSDIRIVFTQGDQEFVVARGNADGDYEFTVDVVVPAELAPGPVELDARAPLFEGYKPDDRPLTVLDVPAIGPSGPEISFGPAEVAPVTTTPAATVPPTTVPPATITVGPAPTPMAPTETVGPPGTVAPTSVAPSAPPDDGSGAGWWIGSAVALVVAVAAGLLAWRLHRRPG